MRSQAEMNALWIIAYADAGYECNEGPAQRVILGMASPKDLDVVYEEMQRVRAEVLHNNLTLPFDKYYASEA